MNYEGIKWVEVNIEVEMCDCGHPKLPHGEGVSVCLNCLNYKSEVGF